VVLDQGRVAEEGSHRALLEGGGGRYAEMWEMQQQHHAMKDGEEGVAEEARRLKRKAAYDLRMQNSNGGKNEGELGKRRGEMKESKRGSKEE